MAKAGKSARQKGNSYELYVKKLHEDIGFTNVHTSRNESKRLDDAGVDLAGLPYNVQCKAVERLSPSLHEILSTMPKDGKINAIYHKRNRKGTIVAVSEKDFMDMLAFLKKNNYF